MPRTRLIDVESCEPRICLAAIVQANHDVVFPELVLPDSVHVGDIDGDGDPDILSGSEGALAWHENVDGEGDFSRLHVIADSGSSTTRGHAADLDGDGDLDILATAPLVWYENVDGTGDFGGPNPIADAPSFYHVLAADLDGDGDWDVLAASHQTNTRQTVWFENLDGLGTFSPENQLVPSNARSLSVGDMDGDGDLDVLTGTRSWYENQISAGNNVWPSHASPGDALVAAADIDGDGDLDGVSVTNNYKHDYYVIGTLVWLENQDGRGNLGMPRTISEERFGIGPTTLVDIDGDGDTDVLSTFNGSPNSFVWFENMDGLGTMSVAQPFAVGRPSYIRAIDTADLNGDGGLDAVMASRTNHAIAWFPNESNQFGDRRHVVLGAGGDTSPRLLDVDGDRDLDIVAGESWFANVDGRGTFDEWSRNSPPWANGIPIDFDGDGDQDRLSSVRLPARPVDIESFHELVWYENVDGNLAFERREQLDLLSEFVVDRDPFAMDFDSDGDMDVIWPNSRSVTWYENTDGRGNFSEPRAAETRARDSIDIVLPGDLDGDGDSDLVFVDVRNTYWRANSGGGIFGPRQTITEEGTSRPSAHLRDFDGDEDLDLVLTSLGSSAWYRNDGRGTFAREHLGFPPNTTTLPADVDQDGDLDLIGYHGSWLGGFVHWHENIDGLGTFRLHSSIASGAVRRVMAEDFDADGDLDIVVAGSHNNNTSIYYENTNGKDFGPGQILRDHGFLATGDIDADGDADFASGARDVEQFFRFTIRWYHDRVVGDSNNDGRFDSSDLVAVFVEGKYEDGVAGTTTFDQGDWNQDGEFDSRDLVFAFEVGNYVVAAGSLKAEIASAVDFLFAQDEDAKRSFVA